MSRGSKLPEPQAFALLGDVHRLSFRRPDGGVTRYGWGRTTYKTDTEFEGAEQIACEGSPPQLLWAPDLRALFIFPGFHVPASAFVRGPIPARAQGAVDAFHAWDHHARWPDTRCAVPSYPEPRVRKVGSAIDVVYRSEKWNGRHGHREDYQHHFSKSGRVSVAVDQAAGPSCILVRGGRLALNERGIVY